MSALPFFRHWAQNDVFNQCHEEWRADIGVLTFGKTFMGFRYRTGDDEIICILNAHLPKSVKNIIKSLEVRVVEKTAKQVATLCKVYRNWSFSIDDRNSGVYRRDFHSFRFYVNEIAKLGEAMPYSWPHTQADLRWYINYRDARHGRSMRGQFGVAKDIARFNELSRSHLEMMICQLICVGVIEDDPYAVVYRPTTVGYHGYDGFKLVTTCKNREQMVAAQLADMGEEGEAASRYFIVGER